MITEIGWLYESIYCSEYGAEHREELIEKHRDQLPELAKEHQRLGMKVDGKPASLMNEDTGEIEFDIPSRQEMPAVSDDPFTIDFGTIVKYALWTLALILLWRAGT